MASTGAIEAHYDAFPYPETRCVVAAGPPSHVAGTLSFLLRRRPHEWISTQSTIWIAGCGTTQASQWALTFPEADILATDVSARTIEIASSLAREVGATNVRFERRDLRTPWDRKFDLVLSTGVVHHLEDPAAGLRSLRAALSPSGAAFVMVYSRVHRAPLDPLRRAIARLPPEGDAYEHACRLLAAAISPRCRPEHRDVLEALHAMRQDQRSFLADLLVNPREQSYDLAGLRTLLADGGLRFVEWRHPGAWRLRNYVDDEALVARARALGDRAESELVYDLAGLASPMLDVLVERDDAPRRPPYSQDELCAMRMLVSAGERQLDIDRGRLTGERHVPACDRSLAGVTGLVTGPASGGHGSTRHWAVTADTLPLIDMCDGTRTVAELCEAFTPRAPRQQILSLIEELSPRDVGLLAPVSAP